MMNTQEILECIQQLNRDELFYKEYFLSSGSSTKRNQFLAKVDPKDLRARRLIVPELAPDQIP